MAEAKIDFLLAEEQGAFSQDQEHVVDPGMNLLKRAPHQDVVWRKGKKTLAFYQRASTQGPAGSDKVSDLLVLTG